MKKRLDVGYQETCVAVLDNNPKPNEEEIRCGISGNLCRCTGYQNIVKSVQYASNKLEVSQAEGGK